MYGAATLQCEPSVEVICFVTNPVCGKIRELYEGGYDAESETESEYESEGNVAQDMRLDPQSERCISASKLVVFYW